MVKDAHIVQGKEEMLYNNMKKIEYINKQTKDKGEDSIYAERREKLRTEFHPIRNGSLQFDQLSISSGKKVWWICEYGHEWQAVFNTRTIRGYGCSVCSGKVIVPGINDFLTLYPEIAKEAHPTKNKGIDLSKLGGKSSKKIWWLCCKGHEFEQVIAKRTSRGDGCPYCSGRYPIIGENDLGTLASYVSVFWDKESNGEMCNYTAHSTKTVKWKCPQKHAWFNKISNQVNYNVCPYCSGKYLIVGVNDVATVYPMFVDEWDDLENGKKASEVKANTRYRAAWKCDKNHKYRATIYNRLKGRGCPYCAGKKPIIGVNDLETLYADLIKEEWDYIKNRRKPCEFLPKSNHRAWWKCKNNHSWKALISERTRGTGCLECRRREKRGEKN